MEILLNYKYRGNVRELENILEHALIICQEETLQSKHLPEYLQIHHAARKFPSTRHVKPDNFDDEGERDTIISMLQRYNWNRTKTAKALGMDRTTLWRKIKKYGIEN
jgi:transcriptional regulator of acetoin/glycerol metabolism